MFIDQWGEIHPLATSEKEKPLEPSQLGGNEELGVEALSEIGRKVERYGTAKARNRQMAGFLAQSSPSRTNDAYKRLSRQMYDCASWLEFHRYAQSGEIKLARASLCKKHLLCPVCAIRRGVRTLANYHKRALHLAPQHDFYLVTLTVKNGPDLFERFQHLKHSFKRLRARGKKGYGVWSAVDGAIWSTEFTKSQAGWHPHLHVIAALPKGETPIRYGEGSRLRQDWETITGDSFITHAQLIKGTDEELASGLCEVLKYALKFSDLTLADNLAAYEVLKGKRLVQASGCFYGLELPEDDSLLDEPLDEEYEVLFFKYGASGYRLSTH